MQLSKRLNIDSFQHFHHTGCMLTKYVFFMLSALVFFAPSAYAVIATGNLSVSVVVPPVVQVSVTKMGFGSVLSGDTATSTATITVNIVDTQAYHISLDAGLNFSSERRVKSKSANFRSYVLYQNSARTQLWGDSGFAASYAAGSSRASTGTGSNQQFIIYGSVSASTASPPSGSYTDQVTVTVHY